MFTQMLSIINKIPAKTIFSISISFFAANGLVVSKKDVISFGHYFAKHYKAHNCGVYFAKNRGILSITKSNNIRIYIKK